MVLLCSTQSDVRVNFLGRLWHCVKIYLNASNKAPWPFSSYGSSEGVLNFDFHFVGNLRPNFQHNWKPLSTVHCILPRHSTCDGLCRPDVDCVHEIGWKVTM